MKIKNKQKNQGEYDHTNTIYRQKDTQPAAHFIIFKRVPQKRNIHVKQ